MPKQSNRLIHETSPYLKQHAYNPVDWYPWSEEAFAAAKRLDKPILLSIGYSACHWCHVMERESFENEPIAALMNELFINVKVDKEERPDVDQIYMQFVQVATGQGGWPMTIFLTPDKQPFFGGTYFPPEDRYGKPAFPKILESISYYYHKDKVKLKNILDQVDTIFTELNSENVSNTNIPDENVFNQVVQKLARYYEPEYGGIGKAPKFPAVQVFQLFLRKYHNDQDKKYLDMIEHTLQNMGRGGIFDQLGGGFARYSVDNEWQVPHFEKMLYDNAQLASLYFDTYLKTKNKFYLNIAEGVLCFIERDMISNEGGFYSSLDADSDGEEGKYYTWSKKEVIKLLEDEKGQIICEYFDITEGGNFEGKNIPRIVLDKKKLAKNYKKSVEELNEILSESKGILLKARSKRVHPGLDDKIIVSWNGLMLSAYAKAYQITGRKRYAQIIQSNLTFLKNRLYQNNKLKHTYTNKRAKINAFIDDYANLIQGLLDAYEALFDTSLMKWAIELIKHANEKFWDNKGVGYFFTSSEHEKLLTRLKDTHDQSIPSANSVMLMNLLRISAYTGNSKFQEMAEQILIKYSDNFIDNPYAYASYLNALDFCLRKPKEIIIIPNIKVDKNALITQIFKTYISNKIIIYNYKQVNRHLFNKELLTGKEAIDNKTTVYICYDFTCSPPITTFEDLTDYLNK